MEHSEARAGRPATIGLIGGAGHMGAMFRPLFEAEGHRVRVAGPSDDPTYDGLVTGSDMVIVTVPIAETEAVIGRIAPHLRPDQLLSDFTSIKGRPVRAMLATPACVIGGHPLFAPMASPAGQNMVLCPARPGPYLDWYRGFLERQGLKVVLMAPEAHDEAMAFIQGLTHFLNIAFARTLQTRKADLERILQVCSPVYQVMFAILCRVLSGDARLYGQIQTANPHNPPVLADFLANGETLLASVRSGAAEEVYRLFDEAAEYLGPFREVARQRSDFLIEQMTAYLRTHDPEESA
jgi:prephenate dehydrogenase